MFSIFVERLLCIFILISHTAATATSDDFKDDSLDRGAHSDRQGLWFGPRLGKRSLQLSNDDNRNTFLRLLEAADTLKYYYDQLPYEMQADEPKRVTKQVIFTPILGRAADSPDKRYDNVEFTPRLGRRRIPEVLPVTTAEEEMYRSDPVMLNPMSNLFSPRLGRNIQFSPRLGRELNYGFVLKFIEGFDSYVLLAANVHDFRNIAKKLVPEPLADRLARLASKIPAKKVTDEQRDYDYESETENDYENAKRDDITEGSDEKPNMKPKTPKSEDVYVKGWGGAVNFDELVERVKDRLAKEINFEFQKGPEPEKVTQTKSVNNNHDEKTFAEIEDHSEVENVETKHDSYKDYSNPDTAYVEDIENKHYVEKKFQAKDNDEITSNERYPAYANDDFQTKKDVDKNPGGQYNVDYEPLEKAQLSHKEREFEQEPHKSKNQVKDYQNSDSQRGQYKLGHGVKKSKYVNEKYANPEKQYGIYNEDDSASYKKPESIQIPSKTDETPNKSSKNTAKYENPNPDKYNSGKYETKYDREDQSISHVANKNKQSVANNNAGLYDQIDLSKTKNDSYEDYVTPYKEGNVFESDELNKQSYKITNERQKTISTVKNSRFKIKNNAYSGFQPLVDDARNEKEYETKQEVYQVKESQDIKAKTENLWFNDDALKDYGSVSERPKVTVKSIGTMITTRQYYKIVSPNYYISLPTVAEKYDSNEPLPERDRERKVVKHFVNPPASINKKVRLT